MAASEDMGPNLPTIFASIWKTYEYTDTTNDGTGEESYQSRLAEAIAQCERAVHMTNQLHLFSDNEVIEEVSTADMRYLLLPAFLGYFTTKLTKGDRLENLKKAQTYYVDFLRLCKNYEVTTAEIPQINENPEASTSNGSTSMMSRGGTSQEDIKRMANQRAAKIQRFRRKKEIEQNLSKLYEQVQKEHVDDDVKREYYNTLLSKWVDTSIDELEGIQEEFPMLLHMQAMKAQGGPPSPKPKQEKPPMRPFILTKSELQKQVFGLGYPSIPTYTLDQFYEAQVAGGMLPQPGSAPAAPVDERAEAEKAEAEKEKKVEEDDEETLRKAREWDEYTDEHRRGWGNTKNQG